MNTKQIRTTDTEASNEMNLPHIEMSATQPPFLASDVRPSISLIMPTFNNADMLPEVIRNIPAWIDEVIIIDGRSTDGTVALARQLREDIQIVIEPKVGLGASLRAGFQAAHGDIIIWCRADGSMDPREAAKFVGSLMSGHDYVKGSRFLHGGSSASMSFVRKLGHQSLAMATRVLFRSAYTDPRYSYIAFWSRVLQVLDIDYDDFGLETVLNLQALHNGLSVMEIPSYESRRSSFNSLVQGSQDLGRLFKLFFRERTMPHRNRVRAHWTWQVENPMGFRAKFDA